MKPIYIAFTYIAFAIFTFSCKNKTDKNPDYSSETASVETMEFEGYSFKFKKIMLLDSGVFRGFDFSSKRNEIIANENAQLLDEKKDSISFSIEFNEFELADIIYHLKNNTVNAFEVQMYLKNKASADSLLYDFNRFFEEKFEVQYRAGDSTIIWGDRYHHIRLDYIDQSIDHGIQILIQETENNQALGSLN